ncbi:MAG: glycosyltransferase [Chthoniobacter sp.]|nr:glycosyltransferase [Chthoniobacter sp.]
MNVLVSIVLPVYNGSTYLRQSLESCLTQTFTQWELIAVDDCSTDETPQILAEYAARDPRIRTIRNSENRKLPESLNIGFTESKGGYLTWTSDDNLYLPDALAEMVSYLDGNKSVDIVYADYSFIDAQGEIRAKIRVDDAVTLAYRNCVGVCFLYRRVVHEKLGGYDTSLFLVEDYDFFLRAFAEFRLEPLHRNLYLARQHGGSLSTTQNDRVLAATGLLIERHFPTFTNLDAVILSRRHVKLAIIALHFGRMHSARAHCWSALRSNFRLLSDAKVVLVFFQAFLGNRMHTLILQVYRRFKRAND